MPTSVSVPIPNGVFSVGSNTYGPLALANGDDQILVTLDRTANQGLNARANTQVTIEFELQLPGDPTWIYQGGGTFDGGIRTDPELGQLNTDYLGVSVWQPGTPGRQARCRVTVAGQQVRLSGTLKVGTDLTVV